MTDPAATAREIVNLIRHMAVHRGDFNVIDKVESDIAAALQKHGDEQYVRGEAETREEWTKDLADLGLKFSMDKIHAPKDHILDPGGVVRRVIGSPVLTADGCLAGYGADVSWVDFEGHVVDGAVKYYVRDNSSMPCESWVPARLCYSTRALAEAAAESAKTKEPT